MLMGYSADFLNASGLALDIVGIIGLFLFSPEKYPDPQWSAFFALEDKELRPQWRRRQRIRRRISGTCMIAIAVGFALQLVAVIVF